jgi:hypothetical protein
VEESGCGCSQIVNEINFYLFICVSFMYPIFISIQVVLLVQTPEKLALSKLV